jgi:hypothetical protein
VGLKIAVIGLSPKTHDLAPWNDPDWQKYGLPWDEGYWQRLDCGFEMHDSRLLASEHSRRKADYLDRLKELPRLYMQANYPFDDVAKTIGGYYFNSSIAYAMALAIHEGAEEIGVWGVDLVADEEYAYQRPNMEYLIGIARGRGIKVHIPDDSALCKFNGTGIRFYSHYPAYVDRYGFLGE